MLTGRQNLPETRLLGEFKGVVEALPCTPPLRILGLTLEPEATATGYRPDATADIEVGTNQYRYAVEGKTLVDRAAALPQLKTKLEKCGEHAMLFTYYLTPALADHCREIGLQFIDTAGNAYLRVPGLYLFIKGQKPLELPPRVANAQFGATATALRVDFALLNRPQLINATHREIAQVAHVALGAVGRVFADLEARGYIRGAPNKRRLLEPERLFDEWVTNYPIRLRPKLNPRRFHATDTDWWHNTHLNDRRAWWGGEVGADRLTNYLKPRTCTIYLDPVGRTNEQDDLIRVHRLRPDLNGEIEFLDAFWHFPPGPNDANTVPPMLVYADLVATLDPRNLEVAKLIREQHIQDALRKA